MSFMYSSYISANINPPNSTIREDLTFIPNRHAVLKATYSGDGPGSNPGGMARFHSGDEFGTVHDRIIRNRKYTVTVRLLHCKTQVPNQ